MLPASNRGVGMNMGFPDVCNTIVGPATAPIPYPNMAMNVQAAPFSPVVKVSMMNALNMGSKIPMTSGDEAGAAHPTIKGMGAYTMGNPIVFIDRLPAVHLTCPTTGNNMNNPLGAVLVPSAVNVLYTYRAPHGSDRASVDPYGCALSPADLAALDASLRIAEPVSAGVLLSAGVGHLRVALFAAEAPARAYVEVLRLSALGARALILDLRGNPGGELDAAVRLAGEFLAAGEVIARIVDAEGDEIVHRAAPGAPSALPLVVLVDGATASAAELFAGSLQAQRRAVVVGETTFGKGLAQQVTPAIDGIEEGAFVAYRTVARCLLPDGSEIQGAGVRPDLEILGGAARWVPGEGSEIVADPQIVAAIEVAEAMIGEVEFAAG
jgi:carboxyl-terminal processing protease